MTGSQHGPLRRMRAVLTCSLGLLVSAGVPSAAAQTPDEGMPELDGSHDASVPQAHAVQTSSTIQVDGVLDEAAWMTAEPITEFYQTTLDEGAPVTQPTEVRFLYDDDHIYVGAWLWDDGEVLTRLARRDAGVPDADFFVVLFDSYHDHRTAYRFATSPSAMKRDEIVTEGYGGGGGGGFGDTSWDPVWDIESTTTDEGWFVEMRIPFSQLRYRDIPIHQWGLQVERKIRRRGEDTVWAYTPPEERAGVARYGHLFGIEDIAQGKRLELLPFVTARAEFKDIPISPEAGFENPYRTGSDLFQNAGLDLKYRLGANLTLDATVNPDFGQVELDPAVINLSAFETRFQERRPFFVEGSEIFRFGDGGGSNAQLLYSRRIGRPPQGSVPGDAEYTDVPGSTTILGAGKLTMKTAGGWSMGVLNAVTGRETADWVDAESSTGQTEVEPLTNYFAARARRDAREGAAAFGMIGTAVHRSLGEGALGDRLHSSAFSGGVDGRIEWANRSWVLASRLAGSLVQGSSSALQRTQRSSARYFARPDAGHLDFDPEATSLSGMMAQVDLEKQAGVWQGSTGLTLVSPGYEVNDLGFQSAADRMDLGGEISYVQPRETERFRSLRVRLSPGAEFNFDGDLLAAEISASANAQLPSFNGFNFGLGRQFAAWDDRLTRGGPLTRKPAGFSANVGFNTDSRNPWTIRTGARYQSDDGGAWSRSANVSFSLRFKESYEIQVGPDIRRSYDPAQYVTSIADETVEATFGRRYVFGAIDQTTVSMDLRFNATFTPELTLELYAQPFVSSGDYSRLGELAAPRTFEFLRYGEDIGEIARDEGGTYTVDPTGEGTRTFTLSDRDFNVRSLLGNAVLRWEWRTGSALFLVWQQVRSERLNALGGIDPSDPVGQFDLGRDAGALFSIDPENVFMLKMTYWINP